MIVRSNGLDPTLSSTVRRPPPLLPIIIMSHSLFQQVSDLKDQLAQQKAECDAVRAECEAWKTRAEQESQEKAMLEALLKDSEQGKIEWWTKFKELQASGPGEGSARKRKRTKDGLGTLGAPLDPSDVRADPRWLVTL